MTLAMRTMLLTAGLLLVSVLIPTGVDAFTFTPDRLETEVYPGVPLTEELTLLNETGDVIRVVLTPVALDLSQAALGRATFLRSTAGDVSMAWLRVSPDQLLLEPGQSRSVDITISAPASASGVLAGGIAAAVRPVRSDESAGEVSIETVTGPFVFANVLSGTETKEGAIDTIGTAGGSRWFSALPVTFEVSFANNGTAYLKPVGEIEVRDVFGRLVATVPLDDQRLVLPHTRRTFNTRWNRQEEPTSALMRELVQPLVGPFTATARMTYDEQTAPAVSTTIWFFPWRSALLLGVILVGVAMSRRRLRRV